MWAGEVVERIIKFLQYATLSKGKMLRELQKNFSSVVKYGYYKSALLFDYSSNSTPFICIDF